MSSREIPLLSPKHISEFTFTEYREYVRSLYFKAEPRKAAAKAKKPYSWSRNRKGTLIVRVRREPKRISESEMNQIALESGEPLNLLYLQLKRKNITLGE